MFADFKRDGENNTLAADLAVDGPLDSRPMAPVKATADAGDGYRVELTGGASKAGEEAELGVRGHPQRRGRSRSTTTSAPRATWSRCAKATWPTSTSTRSRGHGAEANGDAIRFATEFPSDGRYGLFLQFKHEGKVRTAAFTREVAR